MVLFCFFGFFILFFYTKIKVDKMLLLFLIGTILYFGLITGMQGGGDDRFRYPVMPLIFLFAGSSMELIYFVFIKKKKYV